MILLAMLAVLIAGGILAWLAGTRSPTASRVVSLAALGVDAVLGAVLAFRAAALNGLEPPAAPAGAAGAAPWIDELRVAWLPDPGIGFHLAADGLSLAMLLLTVFLGLTAVLVSWREVQERVGFFHLNLLFVLAGLVGVFVALDLFLFYFFWELMLVPMYLLIGIWGHEDRVRSAVKFFLFTQASALLMLVAILGLYFAHWNATGVPSFDYETLLGTPLAPATAFWLMLGFFAAFAVKLPAVPLHTWLPDAHTEAPTAGSVVLAGLLLKTGAYGLIRFGVPLFPQASAQLAPVALGLGVAGILYGALLAFAQTDLKRLVAYTSVSHLGFVLLGIYTWNELALQGVVAQMVCHGLSTGGLFLLVGMLQERTGTRDLAALGGLWETVPRMGAAGMILALASLGLPGLGNFVAEILILFGAFLEHPVYAVAAAAGMVAATIYALRIVQRTFHGANPRGWRLDDLTARELAVLAPTVALLVWLGVHPQPLLDALTPVLQQLPGLY